MPKSLTPPMYRRRMIRGKEVAYLALRDAITGKRRDYWLGPYGSPESRQKYARLIADWESSSRTIDYSPRPAGEGPTITQVCAAYWRSIGGRHGASESGLIAMAIRVLRQYYGETAARDFGPRRLRALRDSMIHGDPPRRPWGRSYISKQLCRVRAVFRWAVAQELLPSTIIEALRALEPLRAGQTVKPDPEPIRPAPEADVEAVKIHVSRQVAAMVDLQLLTGMRPGEVCTMRPVDLDTSGETWAYRPAHHKTAHRGRARTIWLGPRAQLVITPFLSRPVDQPLFSPTEAEHERREAATAARVTPAGLGNATPGTNRADKPTRTPGDAYTTDSYRRAIQRACRKAGVKPWHPHQLRHLFATIMRRQYGLEAAQILLGHSSATLTDAVYAERDEGKATKIAREIG